MRTLMVADSRERRRRWAACSTISASASTLLIDGTLAATPMNPSQRMFKSGRFEWRKR